MSETTELLQTLRTEMRRSFDQVNAHLSQLNGSVSQNQTDIAVLEALRIKDKKDAENDTKRADKLAEIAEDRRWDMWGSLRANSSLLGAIVMIVMYLLSLGG